jgi:hypothetical protein
MKLKMNIFYYFPIFFYYFIQLFYILEASIFVLLFSLFGATFGSFQLLLFILFSFVPCLPFSLSIPVFFRLLKTPKRILK